MAKKKEATNAQQSLMVRIIDLEEELECLEERLYQKDEQILILKHIIGLMGKVIDE